MPGKTFRPSQLTLDRLEQIAAARSHSPAGKANLTAALNWAVYLAEGVQSAAGRDCLDRIAAHLTIATRKPAGLPEAVAFAAKLVDDLFSTGKLTQADVVAALAKGGRP